MIPDFVIRIVSLLAYIRRSTGDEYHYVQAFEKVDELGNTETIFIDDLEKFKMYSELMRDLCLNFN
jgi:hypothetical protein